MKISEFEWDEGNSQHLALGHGIEPAEAEEVFAKSPLFRKTKRGHYAAMGPHPRRPLLGVDLRNAGERDRPCDYRLGYE